MDVTPQTTETPAERRAAATAEPQGSRRADASAAEPAAAERVTAEPAAAEPTAAVMAPELDVVDDPVDDYLRRLSAAIDGLSREDIWQAVDLLLDSCRRQSRVYLIGNGGSAATASHMANDLNKTARIEGKPMFRAISLTDNVPLLTAWSNDEEYAEVFVGQLANHVEPGDVVVGISTSGNSENVLRGLVLAREMGAVTIGFTGDVGGELRHLVDCCVHVPSAHIGRQEDVHLALDHAITVAIRDRLQRE